MKKKKKPVKPTKPTLITNLTLDGHIIEMVRRKSGGYKLLHLTTGGKVGLNERITIRGTIYEPLVNKVVREDHVHMPPLPARGHQDTNILFHDVRKFINQYVTFPEAFLTVATAFVLATWVHRRFQFFPYLQFIGPPGMGKSRALRVITRVGYHGLLQAGATAAVVFTVITDYNCTMAVDEIDRTMKAELQGIYRHGTSFDGSILRLRGKGDYHLEPFRPFGPKLYAGQQPILDVALNSRVITQNMLKVKAESHIVSELSKDFFTQAQELQSRLLRWKFENYFNIKSVVPAFDSMRQQEVFTALLTVCPEEYRGDIYAIAEKQRKSARANAQETLEGEVSAAMKELGPGRFRPQQVADKVNSERKANAASDCAVEMMTAKATASVLRRLGIEPVGRSGKGYVYEWGSEQLEKICGSYLPEDSVLEMHNAQEVAAGGKK